MKQFISAVLMILSFSALSQSSILMEACNRIENKNDRLACFKEIYTQPTQTNAVIDKQQAAIDSIKMEFAELQQVIKTGISYNAYSAAIIKPAMKLGALKLELNNTMPHMVYSLEEAVVAYNDAGTVWRASIYDSQDGGIFVGKVLDPRSSGLLEIVRKYDLKLETKLLTNHLPATAAILKIFDYAEKRTTDAFEPVPLQEENAQSNDSYPKHSQSKGLVNDKCKDRYSLLSHACKDSSPEILDK